MLSITVSVETEECEDRTSSFVESISYLGSMGSGSGSDVEQPSRFLNVIRERLRCRVCSDFSFPVARQCENEHILCRYCFQDKSTCEICGKQKSDNPLDPTIENIQQFVTFPCRYVKYGCNIQDNGSMLRKHQRACLFVHFRCPFYFDKCEFKGTKENIITHLKDIHRDEVTTKHTRRINLNGFGQNRIERRGAFVFFLYNEVFFANYDVDPFWGHIKFAVGMLGPKQNNRVCFRVGFIHSATKTLGDVILKGSCSYLEHEKCSLKEDDYTDIHMKYLNEYCCEETGDLQFIIAIREVPLSIKSMK